MAQYDLSLSGHVAWLGPEWCLSRIHLVLSMDSMDDDMRWEAYLASFCALWVEFLTF